jgi:hypothetical protein
LRGRDHRQYAQGGRSPVTRSSCRDGFRPPIIVAIVGQAGTKSVPAIVPRGQKKSDRVTDRPLPLLRLGVSSCSPSCRRTCRT